MSVLRKWTPERVLSAIRECAVSGVCSSVSCGMTVTVSARRIYGSFAAACEAAGVIAANSLPREPHCQIGGCPYPSRSARIGMCEMHYMRRRRGAQVERADDYCMPITCEYCGERTRGHKFCSERCASRSSRACDHFAVCRHCGVQFVPDNRGRDRLYCSDACLNESLRARSKIYRDRDIDRRREKERAATYRRKALKLGNGYEPVSRTAVFNRDGWVCGLCGDQIPRDAIWPNPMFGTLDHIVPLSKGGPHSEANLQAAHLRCNASKGNRVGQGLLPI